MYQLGPTEYLSGLYTWVMWRGLASQESSYAFVCCLRTSAVWREVIEVWRNIQG